MVIFLYTLFCKKYSFLKGLAQESLLKRKSYYSFEYLFEVCSNEISNFII